MKTSKQPLIFIRVFALSAALFASPSIAENFDSYCDQRRIPSLAVLDEFTNDIQLTEFEIQIEEIELEILKIDEEMKQIPLIISATGKLSHTSEISNEFWDKDYGEVVGINSSYDINIWKQKLKEESQKTRIKIYNAELQVKKNDYYKRKIETLIDIVESQELSKILLNEKSFLSDKLRYFAQIQLGGDNKQLEISEVKVRLGEVSDKLTANKIKLDQNLAYVGLSANAIPSPKVMAVFDVNRFELACEYDPPELVKLAAELRLLEIEEASLEKTNELDLSIGLSIEQRRTHLGHSNEAVLSLSGKLPLYDGGKNSTDRYISKKSKSLKIKGLKRASQDLDLLIKQRRSSERVFTASITSLDLQIAEIDKSLIELNARQKMGQSVFLEIADKRIQKSKLQEAQLRLKCEFLEDWITFLRKVNGFKNP